MNTMEWLLLAWLLVVVHQDSRHRRVPNALVLAGAALALATLVFGAPPIATGLTDALLGAAVAFGALLCWYALRLMGAGDVKFAGALGLWFGLSPLLPIWIGASLLAGAHALAWLALQRWPILPRLALALDGRPLQGETRGRRPRRIPFAAYLAITAMAFVAWRHAA